METENTIHLQGIGKVRAIPASEIKPGMHIMFNYGFTYEVLGVEVLSPAFLRVAMKDSDKGSARLGGCDPERVHYRKVKRTTLVGIAR